MLAMTGERKAAVNDYLSTAQVARRFKRTPRTIVRWIGEGKLPGSFQVNPEAINSPFLIPLASVRAWEQELKKENGNN